MPRRHLFRLLPLVLAVCSASWGAETETFYLSGKGKDDGVKWDFICNAGQNANQPSTINVPSNWELQGFGVFSYGNPGNLPKVQGKYKRTFTLPETGADRQTFIVFEGVMTDTQVFINGQSAGPMHQGGYFRFKYDITKLLKAGENLVEVTVDDESANASINMAERRGDYWNYAGIFRPVYLESVPADHIEQLSIDAKADGTLSTDVALPGAITAAGAWVKMQVRDAAGNPFGAPVQQAVDGPVIHLSSKLADPKLWTAETPNLYTLDVQLGAGAKEIHAVHQKFGFRTIEARPGAGLFVNGSRIMLKGADRHSFWPDSGRTLSEQISHDDIAIMKEMNMNAVRMSHYPPDQHFLDACDAMGMYVLDELPGWHAKYDTPTGVRLVKEMVTRDVNHPCILFWDNGNEGGWNTALDGEFVKYDPQKRLTLHPWDPFPQGIIDTKHYPDYTLFNQKLAGNAVFFPTEFLHGLYDGGLGAGLDDYWQSMTKSKAGAGGFLWSLVDEDVKRVDQGGKVDSKGNAAPDGILGPYREKEGSFYTIKGLWSPIIVTPPATASQPFQVENRYSFINADQCRFVWEDLAFRKPNQPQAGYEVLATRTDRGQSLAPGANAAWPGWGPPVPPAGGVRPVAFALHVKDPNGQEITSYVWPASLGGSATIAENLTREFVDAASPNKSAATENDDALTATAGDLSLQFSKKTGLLAAATRAGKPFSFINGPRLVETAAAQTAGRGNRGGNRGGAAAAPAPAAVAAATSTLTGFTQKTDGNDVVISATFEGAMKSIAYRLHSSGWLTIDYAYALTGPHEYFGVGFDYPEANVQGMRYLGNGPAPVYQNRIAGGTLDVWDKKYNNTMVGDPDDLKAGEHFDYPIFKGFYAGVRWLQLKTTEGPITALLHQDDLFVQVFTPKTPPANLIGQTGVPFPTAGISFLHAIPAIGSKFSGPKSTGPQGQPAVATGDYKGSISLYFGEIH